MMLARATKEVEERRVNEKKREERKSANKWRREAAGCHFSQEVALIRDNEEEKN